MITSATRHAEQPSTPSTHNTEAGLEQCAIFRNLLLSLSPFFRRFLPRWFLASMHGFTAFDVPGAVRLPNVSTTRALCVDVTDCRFPKPRLQQQIIGYFVPPFDSNVVVAHASFRRRNMRLSSRASCDTLLFPSSSPGLTTVTMFLPYWSAESKKFRISYNVESCAVAQVVRATRTQ